MKEYDRIDVRASFKDLPISLGDNIYICPELFRFGLFKNANKNYYYSSFYNEIKKKIGPNGTILINTYTFQVLRYKKRFVYEKTISSSGEFSEYIRNLNGAIRSEHPVFSVSSIGKRSKYFCKNNSFHNYGKDLSILEISKNRRQNFKLRYGFSFKPVSTRSRI